MKVHKDKTVYMIEHETQELKDIWWFFNNYLNHNSAKKENDPNYKIAKEFCDDYRFVVE